LPDHPIRAAAMPFSLDSPTDPRTYTVKIVDSDDGSIGLSAPTPSPGAAFGSSTLAARGSHRAVRALMNGGLYLGPLLELRWERAFLPFSATSSWVS